MNLSDALRAISDATGIPVGGDAASISVGGHSLATPSDLNPLDMKSAFPARGYGDQREKLLYMFVEDGTAPGENRPTDAGLRERISEYVSSVRDDASRERLAEVMRAQYWTKPKRGRAAHLLPFHSSLPHGFRLHTRYKMYRGNLLAHLAWTGAGFDTELLDDLLELFNADGDFSRLDRLFVRAAESWAGEATATAETLLLAPGAEDVRATLESGGPYCQPHLDQFQADLREVLSLRGRMPRRDLIDTLTLLTGFHLGTYYYRVALTLGEGLDRVAALASGAADPGGGCDCSGGLGACALAGRIQFRTGTGGYRAASERDASVRSYRDVHLNRLMSLAASIIAANHAGWLWTTLGGPGWYAANGDEAWGKPRLGELAAALTADSSFAATYDAAAWALAAVYAHSNQNADLGDVANASSGVVALRHAITSHQRSFLRKYSADVVNMLIRPQQDAGHLIAGNGTRISFFELDEPLIFLLVRLVCGERPRRADEFLAALRRYGLEPQDRSERERLLAALERLGMVRKYSDAGESTYVKHPL